MAAFPQVQPQAAVSKDLRTGQEVVPEGIGELARAADDFGQRLQGRLEAAARVRGADAAAADVAAGRPVQRQDDLSAFGAAYNQTAKHALGLRRQAAMAEQMGQAYAEHPDDPDALDRALKDIRAGFGGTGFPDLDSELEGDFLVRHGDLMSRAQAGLHRRTIEQGVANFTGALQLETQKLDQIAAGAGFDTEGGLRVSVALGQLVQRLARYGPRTAFQIGDQTFAADPTRAGAVGADDIQRLAQAAQSSAKTSWIYNAAQRLPDAAAKAAFAQDLRKRWADGDPLLSGLSGAQVDQLAGHLDTLADKAEVDERQARELHAKTAADMIEALQFGAEVDPKAMIAEARAAGDPGLVAKAEFFAEVDRTTPGVLKRVVARSLGLGGDAAGVEWVDPTGEPASAGVGQRAPWTDPAAISAALGAPVTVTSTYRTPAHNAAVGGVATSYHLKGEAADFVPQGMTTAQAAAKLKATGQFVEVIDEGDHVHIAWGDRWAPPKGVAPGTPAFAAWANAKEGFSTDPLGYAQKKRVAEVPVLVPDAWAAEDPQAGAAWGEALRRRQALGPVLARTFGVPARMLTQDEAAYYKSQFEAKPQLAIAFAQKAMAAVGPAGAQQLLREIGQDGAGQAVALHVADLYAKGLPVIASAAAEGLALKAAGAKVPEFAHARGDAVTFDEAQSRVAAAFRFVPEALNAVRQTAELARLADASKGIEHTADYYINSALGQTHLGAKHYGGVVKLNGGAVLAPSWLEQGSLDEVLRAIGRDWEARGTGPRYANGKPMTARDVARAQLLLRPNGRYWLVDPRSNQVLRQADGAPAELDLDANRAFIEAHVPGATLKGR